MGLLTKAIFTNFRSFVDKGIKLELVTLEHDPEMLKDISKLHQKNVNVYITEGLIDIEAIEILDSEAVEGMPIKTKTPSQSAEANNMAAVGAGRGQRKL